MEAGLRLVFFDREPALAGPAQPAANSPPYSPTNVPSGGRRAVSRC